MIRMIINNDRPDCLAKKAILSVFIYLPINNPCFQESCLRSSGISPKNTKNIMWRWKVMFLWFSCFVIWCLFVYEHWFNMKLSSSLKFYAKSSHHHNKRAIITNTLRLLFQALSDGRQSLKRPILMKWVTHGHPPLWCLWQLPAPGPSPGSPWPWRGHSSIRVCPSQPSDTPCRSRWWRGIKADPYR